VQLRHEEEPGSTEYCPAGQSVQLALAAAEKEPAGHAWQVELEVAFVVAE
jgi:hypothetical protein